MNISLDLYNYFYYVCEFKSITKAANFLYVSQPAITKQIKNLENHLGKSLIIRTSKGIELTDDGKILYDEIKDAIEKLNMMEAIFKKKSDKYNQTIKIIAGHYTIEKILLSALLEFNKKYNNIKFELRTYPYHESIQLLREGKADLIFLSIEEIEEKYSNIVIEELKEVEDIFVVSSRIKDKFPDKIKVLELNNYPIICKTRNDIARKNIDKIYKDNDLEFIPTYELSNHWLIGEYVNLDMGIGLLTKNFLKEELNSKKLVHIKTDMSLPRRRLGCAYRKNAVNYSVLKEFIGILKNKI